MAVRVTIAAAGVALLAWVGWVTVQATRVDELARTDPDAALRLDPDYPPALLSVAHRQLREGDPDAAMATARHLLATAPGRGDAFAILALAAVQRGDADAPQLLAIAVQRAPRNRDVRVQAALAALKHKDLPGVMAQVDALLRLSPDRGKVLYPMLTQQSEDQQFADVLAATLARDPPWRPAYLATLARKDASAIGADNVQGWLEQHGELSQAEIAAWLDRMMADGRWGDAFARWVGTLGPGPLVIPPLRNGGFEKDIGGGGFDWRNDPVKGVITDIEAGTGTRNSRAAHLHFIGQAERGNLRQALMRAPGHYRRSSSARAQFLRRHQGLQWVVRCDKGPTIAESDRLEGSFGWRLLNADFEVPATGCAGQWLELRNPAVAGSARQVSGDLWIDDVAITRTPAG
jgi:hypothetical protein